MPERATQDQCDFYIVDVFTNKPLTGNPLAVVANAPQLDEETMQRIAREFNQSETTFLLPTPRSTADWRLRSFTPAGTEVYGAGHNALGAWWWLADAGHLPLETSPTVFSQEIGDRVLPVEISSDAGQPDSIGMKHASATFGMMHDDLSELAVALGLEKGDLGIDQLPARVVSTGAPHLLIPVRDREAIERAAPDPDYLASVLQTVDGQGCYLFCLDTLDSDATAHARFFNPTVGIREDPATGSAAGPLAAYLAKHTVIDDTSSIVIEQGHVMERPSRIEVRIDDDRVHVSGEAVVVAQGTLWL